MCVVEGADSVCKQKVEGESGQVFTPQDTIFAAARAR